MATADEIAGHVTSAFLSCMSGPPSMCSKSVAAGNEWQDIAVVVTLRKPVQFDIAKWTACQLVCEQECKCVVIAPQLVLVASDGTNAVYNLRVSYNPKAVRVQGPVKLSYKDVAFWRRKRPAECEVDTESNDRVRISLQRSSEDASGIVREIMTAFARAQAGLGEKLCLHDASKCSAQVTEVLRLYAELVIHHAGDEKNHREKRGRTDDGGRGAAPAPDTVRPGDLTDLVVPLTHGARIHLRMDEDGPYFEITGVVRRNDLVCIDSSLVGNQINPETTRLLFEMGPDPRLVGRVYVPRKA